MVENELRTEDSLQPVKYLGKILSPHAHGIGIATDPVRILWKQSKKGSVYNRCALSIHSFGLCIYEEIANGTYKSVWYDTIDNISYCVAEPVYHRIFAWIARSTQSNALYCHVVLCKTRRQAGFLAELLAKTFYETYHLRQQQQQQQQQQHPIQNFPSKLPSNCSVCDTVRRRQHLNDTNIDQQKYSNEDYEHISFREPTIARAYVHGYEGNSMTNTSRRSFDYDTALFDDDLSRPMEYYRHDIVYKEY